MCAIISFQSVVPTPKQFVNGNGSPIVRLHLNGAGCPLCVVAIPHGISTGNQRPEVRLESLAARHSRFRDDRTSTACRHESWMLDAGLVN